MATKKKQKKALPAPPEPFIRSPFFWTGFVALWAVLGYLIGFPLVKDDVVIGRIPLIISYARPLETWPVILIHILVSFAGAALVWYLNRLVNESRKKK